MDSIKKGDRVILATAVSPPSKSIPLWGSKYGCVGTSERSTDVTHALISWDNGLQSSFFLYRLQLYDELDQPNEPNLAFKLKKMGIK